MFHAKESHLHSGLDTFDFLFLGMGAANSLIVIKMFEAGLFHRKKVGYIDPKSLKDEITAHDKTFCFWSTDEELEELGLQNLISKSWHKAKINGNEQDIHPYRYHHIAGIDLYRYTQKILRLMGAFEIQDVVSEVGFKKSPQKVTTGSGSVYQAQVIFDSRPPKWEVPLSHQTHLLQSFFGWEIELPQRKFDLESFDMMDFRVPQNGNTQFLYVLPFTQNTALVELTRFGKELIDQESAEIFLDQYIKEHWGEYSLINRESGVIPMSTLTIEKPYLGRNALRTGSNAGRVKPSTGYAFKEMCWDAIQIAQNGANGYYWGFHRMNAHQIGRFAFYDRLLLKILENQPQLGAGIFTSLFDQIQTKKVLSFLEEKTTFWQELPILFSLPKSPFIRAAFRDIFSRTKYFLKDHISILYALILCVCYFFKMETLAYILMGLGLVMVGIPHGALDHILENKSFEGSFKPKFFLKYIGLMGLMYLMWNINEPLALGLFLIYSAWHFGEGDFKEFGKKGSILSFLWGVLILMVLLVSHPLEFNQYLTVFQWVGLMDQLTLLSTFLQGNVLIGISLVLVILTFVRKEYQVFSKVALLLMIGSLLPLIWAFAIYFIGHHSLNGWNQLTKNIPIHPKRLWWASLPFSLGAYVLIFLFVYIAPNAGISMWKQFFIFLSCVSFPHVIEMTLFYQRKIA